MTEPKAIDLPRIDREIGSHEYRCQRLMLKDWIALEVLVVKALGMQVLDIDEKNLSSFAPRILSGANTRDHEALFELIGLALQVKSRGKFSLLTRAKQERWWPLNMKEMASVVALFFEVQFVDFFAGLELLLPPTSDEDQEAEEPNDEESPPAEEYPMS